MSVSPPIPQQIPVSTPSFAPILWTVQGQPFSGNVAGVSVTSSDPTVTTSIDATGTFVNVTLTNPNMTSPATITVSVTNPNTKQVVTVSTVVTLPTTTTATPFPDAGTIGTFQPGTK